MIRRHAHLGFTLIELLITISLIVLLVSIMTVALSSARTAAQVAETQSRLTALKQATVRFKEDVGYYPAVLDSNRDLAAFPVFPSPSSGSPQQMYRYQAQDWYSITSPAEFLLGYGNQAQDGYGKLPGSQQGDLDFEELPRFGIRHPGMDGVWRATDVYAGTGSGSVTDRIPSTRGMLFGPYLEIENEQMFGRILHDSNGVPVVDPVTRNTKVFYPGDPELELLTITEQQALPMVIVDTWGTPIRYYRTTYPNPADPMLPLSGIGRTFPQSNNYDRPTLSDYFALRPSEFTEGRALDGTLPDFRDGLAQQSGDRSTTFELQSGRFAFFSAGPDQKMNAYIRSDAFGLPGNTDELATDEANVDNIVEVGP
jgi:prepilin-type N-terminal cleavage/methylation domain-containing protein